MGGFGLVGVSWWRRWWLRCWRVGFGGGVVGVVLGVVLVVPAFGVGPVWSVTREVAPSVLASGGSGELLLNVRNLGDGTAEGVPVVVSDVLPAGLTATSIVAEVGQLSGAGSAVCVLASLSCEYTGSVVPYGELEVRVGVSVASGVAGTFSNLVSVSGGGAGFVSSRGSVVVGSGSAGFGLEGFSMVALNEDGSPDVQAGSHPFQLTGTFDFNLARVPGEQGTSVVVPVVPPKDLRLDLPAGFVGNPNIVPQCSAEQFATIVSGANTCPAESAVGVTTTRIRFVGTAIDPVFNITPEVGEPARFGFLIDGIVPVILDGSVRSGGDYGVVVSSYNISQLLGVLSSQVTFWGVPGDPRHDQSRGWDCLFQVGCSSPNLPQTPFLTLPTSCSNPVSEPLMSSVEMDSWAEPGDFGSHRSVFTWQDAGGQSLAMSGCNRLSFTPQISVTPDVRAASTPTGLTVDVHVPQTESLLASGLSQAYVRDVTVSLPEGVQISPGGADGLEVCSEGEVGFLGRDVGGTDLFTSSLLGSSGAFCPDASKVGTVQIKTPVLRDPLEGAAYLALQNANPFGSLVAMYIVAEDHKAGVVIKQAGGVVLLEGTGRLVSTFDNTPQAPFEDLALHFFGGSRAPLSTPASCGGYTTDAVFTPWSGNAPVEASSEFKIESGPDGTSCQSPQPFAPGFQAGSTNVQAGAFTPFTVTLTRPDADQALGGVSLQMPPGVSGMLASVPLCPEPQASEGVCGQQSLIGHTIVSAGLGGNPFSVTGGMVFLTGPYAGAPFGLSIVNPTKAGPYTLGDGSVTVRAKIDIDQLTAVVKIASGQLPTMIEGIPLQLQHVNVTVDRAGFVFNPTDCDPLKATGTISSNQGATANVSSPFQVTDCAALAFKPKFTVSTNGKTSRRNGASLSVKLGYPNAPQGSQANLAKVKVQLPKRLPSRLTTLQKACTEQAFAADPASCPAASRIGQATVSTPLLPVKLSGPAYFVSHGGAKFPELIIVLKGDGVTIQVHGETFISKKGITTSTFNSVPDVPFSSFELTLPQGPGSAFAATGNLCKGTLVMPTEFTAQNGAILRQNTPITPTGCHKTPKKHHNKH